MYPKSLENLISALQGLPGVGEKTAERYAYAIYDMDYEQVHALSKAIGEIQSTMHECVVCGNYTDEEKCEICQDLQRDSSTIFVVQSPKDVVAMEKTGAYHGLYHVLNGLIAPSKGILPEDLNIASLLRRCKDIQEVILATPTTLDGETTAMYLSKKIEQGYPEVKVTRLAHGLPTGGLLDYADQMTLSYAFKNRTNMK